MIFFNRKKNYSIQVIDNSSNPTSINFLIGRIKSIDSQINQISRDMIQTQTVRFRSFINKRNDVWGGLQQRFIESSAKTSMDWQKRRLIELSNERRLLQDELDKLTGRFWPKKIRVWLLRIVFISLLIITLFILLMGLFATLYFLPAITLIIIVYFIIKNLKASF